MWFEFKQNTSGKCFGNSKMFQIFYIWRKYIWKRSQPASILIRTFSLTDFFICFCLHLWNFFANYSCQKVYKNKIPEYFMKIWTEIERLVASQFVTKLVFQSSLEFAKFYLKFFLFIINYTLLLAEHFRSNLYMVSYRKNTKIFAVLATQLIYTKSN